EADYPLMQGVVEGTADHSDLALEAAKAKRKVCEAEKHLADCILEHQMTLLNLWHQAANSRLLTADLNVGRMHMERKKNGIAAFTHSEFTAVSLFAMIPDYRTLTHEIITDNVRQLNSVLAVSGVS
ncbi:hypothetical protein P692DRAFT_20761717, partial [Suillus brevipes Sb2]